MGGELEHSTCHRDGDLVSDELFRERVETFLCRRVYSRCAFVCFSTSALSLGSAVLV